VLAAEHTFGFVSYNLSKKLFRDIIARDPNYSMGLKRLGQIALYTDNYQEAVFYMTKYLEVNSYDPEAIFDLGEALYFNHQPNQAQKRFERVIELLDYPDRDSYETLLSAISHLRLKNNRTALDLLTSAQKKDPADLSIKLNILETLVLLEKWQESLDLIKKENLDDELKTKEAKEVVFRADLEPVLTKVDSESKANLTYEELKAVVDLQLALRVKIIRHLCLEGLGRYKEDRELLEDLVNNYPQNKEVLTTIGYYFLDWGEDNNALIYLEKAKTIPPDDPVLNQSYRELKGIYSTGSTLQYNQLEKTTDGQKEYSQLSWSLNGTVMFNDLDRIYYAIKNVSSKRHQTETDITLIEYDPATNIRTRTETTSTTTAENTDATAVNIAYQGHIGYAFDLPMAHNYEVHLWNQGLTGYQLKYLVKIHQPALSFQLDWFSDIPNHDDFDSIQAGVYDSGLGLVGTLALKSMNQNYLFSYLSRAFRFENEEVQGEASQTQMTVGFTQFLMTYPNSLEIDLSYTINSVTGELAEYDETSATTQYKHFMLPFNQLQTAIIFRHHWSEFINTGLVTVLSNGENHEYRTANRSSLPYAFSSSNIKLDLVYLKDSWSFSCYLSYLQEKAGEKSELTTINGIESESITSEKTSDSIEVGITFQYSY
jgi:tetratricopeptide (TPR) repeat protein